MVINFLENLLPGEPYVVPILRGEDVMNVSDSSAVIARLEIFGLTSKLDIGLAF